MLTPKQLSDLPEPLLRLYSEVENDIIADMARRLSRMDFIPSARWQFKKLEELGYSREYILQRLARALGIAKRELEKLMENAADMALESDYEIYRRAGLEPPPLSASPVMQAVLEAGLENTFGLFENLTRTTANTATRQFEHALDRAWLQITSGAFSHTEAVKMAIKGLASKGVAAITYPTGHTDYLDVAVRRATVTGVNQTALKLQEALADEMGCDLVETSAHEGARPSHAVWQGKIFSRSGTHPKYPDFRQSTGYGTGEGLGGWNCRHSFFPYFEGMEPVYPDSELAGMNEKKYEYNGKKLTQYEAEQVQRNIERHIRKWKREFKAMESAGVPTDEAAAKLNQWHRRMDDFLKQTGLKRQKEREMIVTTRKGGASATRNTGKVLSFNPDADFTINVPGYTPKQLEALSAASLEVARSGGLDGKEHLILVDRDIATLVYRETGDQNTVGGEKFWRFLSDNKDNSFIFVHNHNTDGFFSETDMNTLVNTPNIEAMIAVRLDGVKYFAQKKEGLTPPGVFWDAVFAEELKGLNDLVKNGKITSGERARLREEIIVNAILRKYTKGLIELDGRK